MQHPLQKLHRRELSVGDGGLRPVQQHHALEAMSPTITRVTPRSRSSRAAISATDTNSRHSAAMERCSRPSPASCSSMPVTVCTSVSSSRSSWAGRVRPPVTV